MKLRLPDRKLLRMTSEEDPLPYYYRFPYAYPYRKRLRMALSLLGDRRFGSLLEVGVGCGILIPSLCAAADRFYGIDIHSRLPDVARMASAGPARAALVRADALRLPFRDGAFGCVVCVSVLEFLGDADGAIGEFFRVLAPGGTVIAGFPVLNGLTGALYAAMGNPRHKTSHISSHRDIIKAFRKRCPGLVISRFPSVAPLDRALFACVRADAGGMVK